MLACTESKPYSDNKGNSVSGDFVLNNSRIYFGGQNNHVHLNNVIINNCTIFLRNSNSCLYIEKNQISNIYQFIISEDCNCIIREGITNGRILIRVGEGNLIIGRDCMLSQNIYIQNHDGHPIYDIESGELQNPGKSIIIGDHVWVGESVSIMKGTNIGSGSVVGSKAFLSNNMYPNNSVIVGIPAKVIKSNIFWKRLGLHVVSRDKRESMTIDHSKNFQYQHDSLVPYQYLDSELLKISDPRVRINFIKSFLIKNELNKREL